MADSYPKPFSNKIELDKNKVLGRGNSVVYSGSYERHPVAVKRIVVDSLSKEDREVKTQVRLDHDNVLKILTVEQDADFRYIVLELCTGTLADVCNNKYQGPDLPSDWTVLIEIATGLQYIHSKKLIHRDIKPENILISLDGRIKLSDFGLCKETSTNHTYLVSGPLKGTGIWMAQEMLNISVTDSTPIKGSVKSDIFSGGCVFFYFVTRGIHPYGEDNFIVGNIIKDTPVNLYKLNKSDLSFDVIRQMLRHQPNKRIALEQVLDQLEHKLTLQPGYRLANVVRRMSKKSAISYGIDIYNLPFKEVRNRDTQRVDRFYFGKAPLVSNSMQKTILIVGDQGSGKSNLINAMTNYVLGVEWNDDFRVKLIDDDRDQKDKVIFYHLNKTVQSRIGYPLTIVDTPPFTGHPQNDEKISQQIQDCFRSPSNDEIQFKLDAVYYVIHSNRELTQEQLSSQAHRLTVTFGKNILKKAGLIVTHDDEHFPPDMGAVKEAGELFDPFDNNGLPLYYFVLNNSHFFTTNNDYQNTYKRAFFDTSVKIFNRFFYYLSSNMSPPIIVPEDYPPKPLPPPPKSKPWWFPSFLTNGF